MIGLSRWMLFKILVKSLFSNGLLLSSEVVHKDSSERSCDSFSFRSGENYYIVEVTVMKCSYEDWDWE